jgi:hypothetical protein
MRCLTMALFAFLLMPLFSLAQSNYRPGYVVTNKGDTIHGFIDYREWDASPNAINFKTTKDDKTPQSFTPANIVYFNIDDIEAYQTFTGKISMDAIDIDKISVRDTSYRIATVFLKVLQKGKNVELFSYADNVKNRFYIGEAPGYTPIELAYKVHADTQNPNGGTVNENTYLKQLFALANKYNVMDDDLEKTFQTEEYSNWLILKIATRINKISKADYKKSEKSNSGIGFFVSAGSNISTISPGSSSGYFAAGGKSSTSFGAMAGFGIALLPNPNTGKLQILAEATVSNATYKSLYQNKVSPYIPVKASFNQLSVLVTPEIIYNFYNAENFKFFAGAGIILGYDSYSNLVFGAQNTNDNFYGTNTNNLYSFRTVEASFLIKTGVQFSKKWKIFINYLIPDNLQKGGYFQLNSTREQIGINYLFK